VKKKKKVASLKSRANGMSRKWNVAESKCGADGISRKKNIKSRAIDVNPSTLAVCLARTSS